MFGKRPPFPTQFPEPSEVARPSYPSIRENHRMPASIQCGFCYNSVPDPKLTQSLIRVSDDPKPSSLQTCLSVKRQKAASGLQYSTSGTRKTKKRSST